MLHWYYLLMLFLTMAVPIAVTLGVLGAALAVTNQETGAKDARIETRLQRC